MPAGPRTTARIATSLAAMLLAVGISSAADLEPAPDVPRGLDLPNASDFNLRMPRVCDETAAEFEFYPPAPRYVYDNRRGATWTGNGWVYLPVGELPPDGRAPPIAVQPPPHGFHPGGLIMIPCRAIRALPDYLPFEVGPR